MNREDVFNFSAGPSVLPTEVLQTAAAELLNYHGSGLSVMEMSHRSREFMDIFAATKAKLKKALSVPDTQSDRRGRHGRLRRDRQFCQYRREGSGKVLPREHRGIERGYRL